MKRSSPLRWLSLFLVVLGTAVCLLSAAERAHAGSGASAGSAPVAAPATSLGQPVAGPPCAPSAGNPLEPSHAGIEPLGSAEPSGKSATGQPDLTSIPTAGGLPVMVNVAVSVLEIQSFDDVKGEFELTTDLRLRWPDSRLRFEAKGIGGNFVEYRGKAAEEQLTKLWVPNVDVANRLETSGYVGHRLRVFADGQVESIVRTTARYKTDVNVENFPFDVQALKETIVLRDQTTDEVMLHHDKDDEEFSRAASSAQLQLWKIGDVDLESDLMGGWNGEHYSRVTAGLKVTRFPTTGLTTIFIPLLASLLIPLLALWMNRTTREGFEIEAFELANMGIGGLFSVIALSYAVSSAYGSIAGSDNTVTRLFALNYATLALSLMIVILFFRSNIVLRYCGPYVHEQVFKFVLWALPVLTLATSVALVLIAAC